MRDPRNIAEVAALAPAWMGFIFYPRSPRCASGLNPEVVKSLPLATTAVGVFVDAGIDAIVSTCREYGIGTVQLHGVESPDVCRTLRTGGYTVFKAFGLSDDIRWRDLEPYEGCADLFVFDTKTARHGGSGRKFDWSLLDSYPLSIPFLLSGGIGPDDLASVQAMMHHPKMAGIDLNSRFESSAGIKDIEKLTHFITSLRKLNRQ